MTTLIIFMVIDYATGIIVAGVFHRSGKSKSGALESRAGINDSYRIPVPNEEEYIVKLSEVGGTT